MSRPPPMWQHLGAPMSIVSFLWFLKACLWKLGRISHGFHMEASSTYMVSNHILDGYMWSHRLLSNPICLDSVGMTRKKLIRTHPFTFTSHAFVIINKNTTFQCPLLDFFGLCTNVSGSLSASNMDSAWRLRPPTWSQIIFWMDIYVVPWLAVESHPS